LVFPLTLKIEVIYSSEKLGFLWTKWCYNPKHRTLHNFCSLKITNGLFELLKDGRRDSFCPFAHWDLLDQNNLI
jgi:hypothetical protein